MGGNQAVSPAWASEEAPQGSPEAPSWPAHPASAIELVQSFLMAIIIAGFYLIGIRLYRLWEIHEDMNQTLQQEQTLRDENLRLRERRDELNDPDEIAKEAREQFGLAKPDEIPYKP